MLISQDVIHCVYEKEISIYKTFIHGVWNNWLYKSHKKNNADKYKVWICQALTTTKQKDQYWIKSVWSNGLGIFHSHQGSQNNLRQLNYSYTLWGLIVSVSHGGLWSKHSHCHTWLLAEQFFSVALSVLCSFWMTCHWCK